MLSIVIIVFFPITAENTLFGVLDTKQGFESRLTIPGKGGSDPAYPVFYGNTIYPDCGPDGKGGGDPTFPIVGMDYNPNYELGNNPSENPIRPVLAVIGIPIGSI